MATRWQKLNHLVPEPLCRMKEDSQGVVQIVEWKDVRSQPTNAEIDAVPDATADATSKDNEKEDLFNMPIIKALALTIKDELNVLRAVQTPVLPPITNQEAKDKIKSYLP